MCDKVDNACNDRPQQVSDARPTGGQRIGKLLIFGHIGADRFPQQRPDAARAKQAECKFLRAGNQPAKLAVHLLAVEQHFCHTGRCGPYSGNKRASNGFCCTFCCACETTHKAFGLLRFGLHFGQTFGRTGKDRLHLVILRRIRSHPECRTVSLHPPDGLCVCITFLSSAVNVNLKVFPLLRIVRNAACVKRFHSFTQRICLVARFFQRINKRLILLRRELRLTDCIQPFLKLRDLAFQRACLALKGGHSALAAGHSFLEGRFQLLHAAVHGVDLTLQTRCLFRHTTDVHLRCSCFRRRRAAAVGIL